MLILTHKKAAESEQMANIMPGWLPQIVAVANHEVVSYCTICGDQPNTNACSAFLNQTTKRGEGGSRPLDPHLGSAPAYILPSHYSLVVISRLGSFVK